jgi:hypothetical protein
MIELVILGSKIQHQEFEEQNHITWRESLSQNFIVIWDEKIKNTFNSLFFICTEMRFTLNLSKLYARHNDPAFREILY